MYNVDLGKTYVVYHVKAVVSRVAIRLFQSIVPVFGQLFQLKKANWNKLS